MQLTLVNLTELFNFNVINFCCKCKNIFQFFFITVYKKCSIKQKKKNCIKINVLVA